MQEALETTRTRARTTQLELGEKLAQAVTEITLLHHTLRGLTNKLNAALNEEVIHRITDQHNQISPRRLYTCCKQDYNRNVLRVVVETDYFLIIFFDTKVA